MCKKKLGALLLALCCLVFCVRLFPLRVRAAGAAAVLPASDAAPVPLPSLSAASAILCDGVSGASLAEKNADARLPMASTTKIMTGLLAIERLSPDAEITVPPQAVGIEGSSVYLFAGERISVRTLLYALLLSSANDAAVALALTVSGSVEAFADLMNARGAELGLTNTRFVNPHGLPEDAHYTTARDLARLSCAALCNPLFAEIVATKRYTAPQEGTDGTRLFLNHNKLLRTYEGALGVKTGFTKKSGRCLVSAARRDGLLLVCVTLNAPDDWRDHAALLDFGFANYKAFSPLVEPFLLPVVGGKGDVVSVRAADTPSLLFPAAHGEITVKLFAPRFLFAPVAAGDEVGSAEFFEDGKPLFTISLTAENTIEKENTVGFFRRFFRRR